MVITIKDDKNRFNFRVAAIIYNKEKTHILMQKQEGIDKLFFPGGRVEMHEDIDTAIKRETMEELNLNEKFSLKFVAQSFISFPDFKYHELGYYFVTTIEPSKYHFSLDEKFDSFDKSDKPSKFMWINVNELKKYEVIPNNIRDLISNNQVNLEKGVEQLIYKEY